MPSPVSRDSDLQDIANFCNQYLPAESIFAIQCRLQRVLARATAALQLQIDEESRLALITMFSAEFDELRTQTYKFWDSTTEFQFLGANLFVLGWSFPYQSRSDVTVVGNTDALTSRRLILHDAMRASLRMIHKFCELGDSITGPEAVEDVAHTAPLQVYQPKVNFFTFYYAIVTLCSYLSHFPSPTPSDQDRALNHIRIAHKLLLKCANGDEKHEWARMAFNVDLIGQWYAAGRRLPPEAAIRSRMGASLFYDGMQKIAVLKAEKGGRSYMMDLTQPLPEHERRARKASLVTPESEGTRDLADSTITSETMSKDLGIQEGPLDQTGLWPGWGDAIWGWDFNMLDTANLDIDGDIEGTWQL